MLVTEFLERSTEQYPDKTALVFNKKRVSYQDMNSLANRLARVLRDSGVANGDRVVILLDNSVESVVSIFGTLKADAPFVVVNPTTKTEKLTYILNNCEASALITHASKWEIASQAISNTQSLRAALLIGETPFEIPPPSPIINWKEAIASMPDHQPTRKSIDIDLASLIYTSGTTGSPKGVMLTHRNMVAASRSITSYLENTEHDIVLNVLPLSFDYGLYQIIMSAQFSGTVVLEKTFLYPYVIIDLLKREHITGLPIVPTISAILLQMKDLKNEHFPHLRYITNTADTLPVSHIRGLREIFPTARLYSMYGLTECKRVSYLPPEELERRPTSVGKGMPNEQIYLVDENGRIITEPGIVGELIVRGAHVMKGYWGLPEETNMVLREGRYPWERVLYTGDLFRMDEDGFLYFVSRKDDIIKSRGEKVSPKEVEQVLLALPDILEAAVIGVTDEVLGEAIKAYVVLKEGSRSSEKDILGYCDEHLENFMVPKYIEFRRSLPKTTSGKITKRDL